MPIGYDMNDDLQENADDKGVHLIFGIFFDGTRNNRKNVNARKAWEAANGDKTWGEVESESGKIKKPGSWWLDESEKDELAYELYGKKYDDSYENDESNVSRMEPYYKRKTKIYSLYIEGIGTTDLREDDPDSTGGGFGNGANGVRGKVRKACMKVAGRIKRDGYTLVESITFDLFGFSRGAAAARNYVWEVIRETGIMDLVAERYVDYQSYFAGKHERLQTKYPGTPSWGLLGYYLKEAGVLVREEPRIRFVGLYDTVSSYHPNFSATPDFDDVIELQLNQVAVSERVVQLAAADEHREKFALTTIRAVPESMDDYTKGGREIYLPGVHCDIGGSYTDYRDSDFVYELDYSAWLPEMEIEGSKLAEEGWFRKGSGEKKEIYIKKDWYKGWRLFGKPHNKTNRYSYIALHMMGDLADKKRKEMFDLKALNKKFPIDEINTPQLDRIKPKVIEQLNKQYKEYLQLREITSYDIQTGVCTSVTPDDLAVWFSKAVSGMLDEWNHFYDESQPSDDEMLSYAKQRLYSHVFEKGNPWEYKPLKEIMAPYMGGDNYPAMFKELAGELGEQIVLRIIRNRLLHWSSFYNGYLLGSNNTLIQPMKPAKGRTRIKYPKEQSKK